MTIKDIKDQLAELKAAFATFIAGKASSEVQAGFQTKLAAVETAVSSELATAANTISERDATIAKLTSDLAAATEKLTASATTAAAALATEAKRTDETLAALGVDPKTIPAPSAAGSTVTANALVAQLNAITDPVKRTQFFRANKQAIYAARNSN